MIDRLDSWARRAYTGETAGSPPATTPDPMKITLEEATVRATRGAEFLDAKDPGWADRIDLSVLHMAHGVRVGAGYPGCVLCQLSTPGFNNAQSYTRMLDNLGIAIWGRAVVDRGFVSRNADYVYDDYVMLTKAWTPLVRERQTTPTP